MRGKLDGGKDGGRAVGASDDAERSSLLRGKSEQQTDNEHGKDTELGSRTKNSKLEIAQHRTEISHRSHTHKDDGRKES